MTRKRHVDYVRDYAKNLVPVIPHDATLSPNSKIDPGNRGKVPGQRKNDGTWYGGWKDLGDATMALAKKWDEWGAFIGYRTGLAGVIALDVDLTVREDVEAVLALAYGLFGKNLAVRRVDHPDAHQAPHLPAPRRRRCRRRSISTSCRATARMARSSFSGRADISTCMASTPSGSDRTSGKTTPPTFRWCP